MVSYHVITPSLQHLPFLEVNVQPYLHIVPILQLIKNAGSHQQGFKAREKMEEKCHHHHQQQLHGSVLCFLFGPVWKLVGSIPRKKFFPLDYATKAAGRGDNEIVWWKGQQSTAPVVATMSHWIMISLIYKWDLLAAAHSNSINSP